MSDRLHPESIETLHQLVRLHGWTRVHSALLQLEPRTRPGGGVRHTCCRLCGQDIEGIAPYRRGEWRDRGNNTHCNDGRVHAPTL